MKTSFLLLFCAALTAGCAINPDADKALRDERRTNDSVAAAERGVQQLPADTGQHAMPTAPTAPDASDMPVVNPADSASVVPK